MTDLLGVCLRWSDGPDGECVVQPESGPAVTIPLRLIVAGKPVPPRASVRLRASTLEVERHSFVLWPDMTTEPLGEWVLRASPPQDGRRLRRANSALAMGDPGLPLVEAAERVIGFYAARGQEPLAMVEVGSSTEAELVGLGWDGGQLAAVQAQVASVSRAARACGVPAPDVVPEGDDQRVELDLGPARGRAALDGDWLGLHGIVVDEGQRRQGWATRVVRGLLAWGAERGAVTAWLHVESHRSAAVALYAGLGFTTHHTYRYLTPGRG